MYAFESVDSDFVSSQVLAAGEAEISCQAVLSTAEAHKERVESHMNADYYRAYH